MPQPTIFNAATGEWEEISPDESQAEYGIPIGSPRASGEARQDSGFVPLRAPTEPVDVSRPVIASNERRPQLFASTEKGVPSDYKPPEPITPPKEERDRLLKADQERRAQQQSSGTTAPKDDTSAPNTWRQKIVSELDEKPQVKRLAMQMLDTEGGGTATMEALVNRVAMIRQKVPGWSIQDELTSGFYGPINRGYAQSLKLHPKSVKQYEADIEAVRNGSNVIQGRTDQGSRNDPNVNGPGRVPVRGSSEIYNFWKGKRKGVDFSHADAADFAARLLKDPNLQVGNYTADPGRGATGESPDLMGGPKPAGPGFYVWPTADRASPEEVQAARYPQPNKPIGVPGEGTPFGGLAGSGPEQQPGFSTPPPTLTPELADVLASNRWRDPMSGMEVRRAQAVPSMAAIPVYGYDPNPTPITGVPQYAAPQQAVTAQYPYEFGIQPPGEQAPPYRYGTGTLPPDYGTAARQQQAEPPQTASKTAAEAAPAQVAPAQTPSAPPQPQGEEYTPEWQRSLSPADQEKHVIGLHDAFNLFTRGASADGVLSVMEAMYAGVGNNLPDYPIFDHVRKNAKDQTEEVAKMRQWIKDHTPVPRDVEESIVGKAMSFAGQVAPYMATAVATGGAPLLGHSLSMLAGTAQAYDMGRQDYIATMKAQGKPVDESVANRAALKDMAVAVPVQLTLGRLRLNSFFDALAEKGVTVGQAKKLAAEFITHGTAGGAGMGAQTFWQNVVAKELEGYDPKRPFDQGVKDSVITGFLGQGVTDTAMSHFGSMRAAQKAKATKAQLEESATKLGSVKVPDTGAELTPEEQAAFQKGEAAKPTPPAEPPSGAGAPETTAATPSAPAPSTPEEVKYSKNVPPEETPTVKIKTFDRKARDFVETDMEPNRDLHEQLKREENLFTTLINCL